MYLETTYAGTAMLSYCGTFPKCCYGPFLYCSNARRHAAIDPQIDPGDVGRQRTREKRDGTGQLVEFSCSAKRNLAIRPHKRRDGDRASLFPLAGLVTVAQKGKKALRGV